VVDQHRNGIPRREIAACTVDRFRKAQPRKSLCSAQAIESSRPHDPADSPCCTQKIRQTPSPEGICRFSSVAERRAEPVVTLFRAPRQEHSPEWPLRKKRSDHPMREPETLSPDVHPARRRNDGGDAASFQSHAVPANAPSLSGAPRTSQILDHKRCNGSPLRFLCFSEVLAFSLSCYSPPGFSQPHTESNSLPTIATFHEQGAFPILRVIVHSHAGCGASHGCASERPKLIPRKRVTSEPGSFQFSSIQTPLSGFLSTAKVT